MSARTGRNAPCPCGSGKKYKKCCLGKGRARLPGRGILPDPEANPYGHLQAPPAKVGPKRTAEEEPRQAPSSHPAQVSIQDPETARWDAIWDRYRATPPAEQLAFVQKVIEEEPAVLADDAFHLCADLVDEMQSDGRVAEAEALLDLVEARHPAAYQGCQWFPYWRAENALDLGRSLEVPLLQVADDPVRVIDPFLALLDKVAFQGHGRELGLALGKLAGAVRRSRNILLSAEAVEEQALWTRLDLALAAGEDALDLAADEAVERLAAVVRGGDQDPGLAPAELMTLAQYRAGQPPRAWTACDFVAGRADEEQALRLRLLTCELHYELCAGRGWPPTRAELAREQMEGMLVYALSRVPGSAVQPHGRGRKGMSARPAGPGRRPPLLPGRQQVLDLVVQLSRDFFSRPHRLAAVLMALPAWGGFLAGKGLAAEEEARGFQEHLAAMHERLLASLKKLAPDQDLVDAVAAALP